MNRLEYEAKLWDLFYEALDARKAGLEPRTVDFEKEFGERPYHE